MSNLSNLEPFPSAGGHRFHGWVEVSIIEADGSWCWESSEFHGSAWESCHFCGNGKTSWVEWKLTPQASEISPNAWKYHIDGVEDVGRLCLGWRNLAGVNCCGFRECFTQDLGNPRNYNNGPHASGIWRLVKYDLIRSRYLEINNGGSAYFRPTFKWTPLSLGFLLRIIHLKHEPIIDIWRAFQLIQGSIFPT